MSSSDDPGEKPTARERPELAAADAAVTATAETGGVVMSPPEAEKPLPEGTRIGRYLILSQVGQGGMGVVYEAYDPELDRKIALKLLRFPTASEQARPRLLREAQALGQLSHRNVVTVHDVGTHEDGVFLALELVEGDTLAEWLKAERRPWRKIVEVLRDAGRGLESAHAAGIVHRDFKPANVIVGEDGRVCVLDFGIARTASARAGATPREEEPAEAAPAPSETTTGKLKLLDTPLTEAGAIVGTPGFMAPEQLGERGTVDARTDQFAWAVTLYYALYGRLPFRPEQPPKGTPELQPPRDRTVPKRLRRILARALSPDPAGRYPSMGALLDELSRDPAERLRRNWPLLVGLGVGALVLAGLAFEQARPNPCVDAARRLDETWSVKAQGAIERAFAATGSPRAHDAAVRVSAAFDGWAAGWRKMRVQACEATQVEHTQSPALLDLRMACLDRRLDGLKELAGVLAGPQKADALDGAVDAALSLPGLERCADAQALAAVAPLPEGKDARAAIAALEQKLSRVDALEAAGRFEPALGLLEPELPEARRLGYPPLLAEALDLEASLEDHLGHDERAAALWTEAAEQAARAHDDERTATALSNLVWSLGYKQERFDEALLLAKVVRVWVARAHDEPRLLAQVVAASGLVKLFKGEHAEAEDELREALRMREETAGENSLAVARTLDALGTVLEFRGKYDEAVAAGRRALAIREQLFGAEHPDVSFALVNLAEGLLAEGLPDEALPLAERALQLRERTLPAGHPDIAWGLMTRGAVLQAKGEHDRALADYDRAHRLLGPDADTGAVGSGMLLRRRGTLYLDRGEIKRALETLRQSLASYERGAGEKHPDLPLVLLALGKAQLAAGQPGEARASLERGLTLGAQAHAPTHTLAELHLRLAEARVRLGDRAGGLREAELAKKLLGDAGYPVLRALAAETRAWLAAHAR